ncbi:MAG: hydroxyacylglutathione hydrolase C-terminal domain-containing protein, partial [Asticcacaulis sp.]
EVTKTGPLDRVVGEGETVTVGETRLTVIGLPGHTLGHIGYHDADGGNVFAGDTMFTLGCGRLFEGTKEQMWSSLLKLAELPAETTLYSAHEYTLGNLKFAESLGVDEALRARAVRIRAMRERNEPTVPTTVGEERATNPFLVHPLREIGFAVQADRFGKLRAAKDGFS